MIRGSDNEFIAQNTIIWCIDNVIWWSRRFDSRPCCYTEHFDSPSSPCILFWNMLYCYIVYKLRICPPFNFKEVRIHWGGARYAQIISESRTTLNAPDIFSFFQFLSATDFGPECPMIFFRDWWWLWWVLHTNFFGCIGGVELWYSGGLEAGFQGSKIGSFFGGKLNFNVFPTFRWDIQNLMVLSYSTSKTDPESILWRSYTKGGQI